MDGTVNINESFVYIWYDAPNKMYYLGKHKGSPDDTYTHSSTLMESFTKNTIPKGFTRRILVYGTDKEMYLLENELLINRKKRCWDRYYNRSLGDIRYAAPTGENHPSWKGGISLDMKAYRKAYNQTPEVKAKDKARKQTPEYKAYMKARKQTPEYKAYIKVYCQTPEVKAYHKARQQTPEYKAYNKARQQTPEGKAYKKAYRQTPEYKAKDKAYKQTPAYKAYHTAYMKAYRAKKKAEKEGVI